MPRLPISCSSLDRILKCPTSARLPAINKPSSDAAKSGNREHGLALDNFLKNNIDSPYLRYVASPKAYYSGIEWKGNRHFNNFTLTGIVDFWRVIGSTLEIIDLKTGSYPVSPISNQLKGYALLLCDTLSSFDVHIENVKLTIFQFDKPISIVLTKADLDLFSEYLCNRIDSEDTVEGKHCVYCPCWLSCPLKTAVTERSHDHMKIPTSLDFKRSRELLLAKSDIVRYLDELKSNFINDYPDSVEYRTRKAKYWKDARSAPTKGMTVAEAMKSGYSVDGLFDVTESKIARII